MDRLWQVILWNPSARAVRLIQAVLLTAALSLGGVLVFTPGAQEAGAVNYYVTDSYTFAAPCDIVTATPLACSPQVLLPGTPGANLTWVIDWDIQRFSGGSPVGSVVTLTGSLTSTPYSYCNGSSPCQRTPAFPSSSGIWESQNYMVLGYTVETPGGSGSTPKAFIGTPLSAYPDIATPSREEWTDMCTYLEECAARVSGSWGLEQTVIASYEGYDAEGTYFKMTLTQVHSCGISACTDWVIFPVVTGMHVYNIRLAASGDPSAQILAVDDWE